MKKICTLILISALFLAVTEFASAGKSEKIAPDCTFHGKKLFGKVKYVSSFPDIKAKASDAFPDLKVQVVTAFPSSCGKWQIVDAFPDIKVQFVDAFPDITIQFVDAFPGIPQ